MRIPILLLGLCTACATPVYDLTAEEVRAPDPAGGIVAGHIAFDDMDLRRQDDGEEFTIEPAAADFLVDLDPGVYEILSVGPYRLSFDKVTFEAEAGRAIYIGTIVRGRDDDGRLILLLRDRRPDVESALVERYGVHAPELQTSLARSSLEGLKPGEEFAIEVHRPSSNVTYSIGFGYYGGYHHHYHRYR